MELAALAFWSLWGVQAVQRVTEMATTRRNMRRMVEQGGRFVADDGYGLLVLTHTSFFFLAAVEFMQSPRAGLGWWTLPGLGVFLVGEVLRGWAVHALGPRYATRIVVMPTAPLVSGGPYRFVRHPIYVGVTLLLAGFPLAFGLWGTAAIIAVLNAAALARRIRLEERALGLAVG